MFKIFYNQRYWIIISFFLYINAFIILFYLAQHINSFAISLSYYSMETLFYLDYISFALSSSNITLIGFLCYLFLHTFSFSYQSLLICQVSDSEGLLIEILSCRDFKKRQATCTYTIQRIAEALRLSSYLLP